MSTTQTGHREWVWVVGCLKALKTIDELSDGLGIYGRAWMQRIGGAIAAEINRHPSYGLYLSCHGLRARYNAENRLAAQNICRAWEEALHPCHQLPIKDWCDYAGPGGFMGHTCRSKSIDKA